MFHWNFLCGKIYCLIVLFEMVASTLVYFGVLAITLYLIKSILFKSKRKLPPGPIVWPIIGNVLELAAINSKYPHLALAKYARKYGNIMGFGFGSQYSVVLSGYDEIREIMKMPEVSEYRFESASVKDRSFNKTLGIAWNGGEAWWEIRNFTVRALRDFGFGKKASMEVLIAEEAEVLIKNIQASTLANNGVLVVNTHNFTASVINVIWEIIAGDKLDSNDPIVQNILRLNDEIVLILSQKNIYNTFPALKRWFPKLVKHDVHMKIHAEYHAFMRGLIRGVEQKRAQRVDTSAQNFIETFVDEIEKNKGQQSNFTEEQMIVTLLDIFLAGSETTSMVISWVVLFLTMNREAQEKLQREIREVGAQHGNEIPLEVASKLPYLNAVILEAMRLGNGAPIPIPRLVKEDVHFKELIIPKGTVLLSNMTLVLMDEEFWGDPKVFRPERFLDEFGEIIPDYAERAEQFGFGKRRCIGDTIARDTLLIFIAAIFGKFNFESIKGSEPSAENPISSTTIRPRTFSVRVFEA